MRYVKLRYIKWALISLVALTIFGFFNYTLPSHDIVRITGTEVIRQDFSGWNRIFYAQPDSGNVNGVNRDLRLINAVYPDGSIIVYRNEDTGWGWPPYFKFDTSNVQAKATALVSTKAAPRWAEITRYGWRNIFLSIYPNVVSIREVANPNIRIIPWFNIIFLIVLALVLLRLYRSLQKFRRRRIDPLFEEMGEAWDSVSDQAGAVGDRATGIWGRLRALLRTWRAR